MLRQFLKATVLLAPLALAQNAAAVPSASLAASNLGIGTLGFSVVGTTITLNEVWTSTSFGAVLLQGLDANVDYTLVKNITNNSGLSWTSFANELLDPAGQPDDSNDPQPYPSFVPAGFTTSTDFDGLSFAQGSGLPRTSTVFPTIAVDELSDARDFIDFVGGTLAPGANAVVTYGLRDNTGTNQPFILSQRPNARSVETVPEPGTLALLGAALANLGLRLRRRG